MTYIRKSGEPSSLGDINSSQGQFREQINALSDIVRQLGGKATASSSGSVVNDPLSAPYILYVNSYIGNDTFVPGDYATADDGTFRQKVRRISQQRLECGYTEARPFKTINRAVIEAAIITSRDYLTLGAVCGDLVTIVVASGLHEVINGPGSADTDANFPPISTVIEPSIEFLRSFNPEGGSGLILPRGVSIVSLDLRKTRITPCWIPNFADESANYSNRGAIFRCTGGGYFFGFTFGDKINSTDSHHLLDCFAFATSSQLDTFYTKIRKTFNANYSISNSFAVQRVQESQITGPVPPPGQQTSATDTTAGSSPYIYNTSIRSNYGLCGIFADGGEGVSGFQSYVVAQFTGVSLQKDLRCWQYYNAGSWQNYTNTAEDYASYIAEQPNNVRFDPNRRSYHIRAINRAIIQEVSVFAIGQSIHHAVKNGGELTVTNSNSNFGGCCALAEGYNEDSFITDTNWNIGRIVVARDLSALENKFSTINIGVIADGEGNNDTTLTIVDALEGDTQNAPTVLSRSGYTLNNYGGTNYIWLVNPNGVDYYAPLADDAWLPGSPDRIRVSSAFVSADRNTPPSNDDSSPFPPIAGLKMYVRRLKDVRTLDERSVTLICNNTAANSRNIVRDYGLQTNTIAATIDSEISANETIIAQEVKVLPPDVSGVFRKNKITVRRASASADWDDRGEYRSGYHSPNNYYRTGDTCRYQNKHYKCIKEHIAPEAFDATKWDESLVHMESNFAAEDFFKNTRPVIIFDKDKDNTGQDPLLGYTESDWSNDPELARQHRTAVDYLGVYSLLRSLGFSASQSNEILYPAAPADREKDPNTQIISGTPNGAANNWDNWAVEFRRPSQIRLFGHAMEWPGTLNYTKALPQYQLDLSPSNKFSYYFTNAYGGRVYLSAFNEEGYQITAGGLLDLTTGESISPEGLGSDTASGDTTVFPGDVVVSGELTADLIQSDQQSRVLLSLPEGADRPPSDGRGMCWIAPAEVIPGVSDFEATDFNDQNENGTIQGALNIGGNGYSGPHFVTPAFLDLWKAKNGLLGRAGGTIKIYVNPRAKQKEGAFPNPGQNESYNWDATSITPLISRPPTSPQNAVNSLKLAVQFANLYVSTTTPVNFYCGNGVYYRDRGQITFEHDVLVVGYDFSTGLLITDGAAGNSGGTQARSWLGTTSNGMGSGDGRFVLQGDDLEDEILNTDKYPCFITEVRFQARNQNTQTNIQFLPTRMLFKKRGTLQGLIWWGARQTLQMVQGTRSLPANDQLNMVPNSIFQLSAAELEIVRQQTTPSGTLNAMVYQLIAANSDTGNINYIQNVPVFYVYGEFRTRDVVLCAHGMPFFNIGTNSDQPTIEMRASATLRLNGLMLVGNNCLDSEGYSDQTVPRPLLFNQQTYKIYGFSPCFASMGPNAGNSVGSFQWCGWGNPYRRAANDYVWNTTYFNVHLINNQYQYMSDNDTQYGGTNTENDALMGPAWPELIGKLCRKRRLLQNSYISYRARSASAKPGWCGNFGRWKRNWGSNPTAWRSVGLSRLDSNASVNPSATEGNPNGAITSGTAWEYEDGDCFLKRAAANSISPSGGTFTEPRILSSNYSYGAGGTLSVQLNIKYAIAQTGIDYEYNYQTNRALYG